jgi:hypothetical protein
MTSPAIGSWRLSLAPGRAAVSLVDLGIHRIPQASRCDGFGHPSHLRPAPADGFGDSSGKSGVNPGIHRTRGAYGFGIHRARARVPSDHEPYMG